MMHNPDKPKLSSCGNPYIPKGDGDEAVQKYISAMPGWKSNVGRKIDAIVAATFPEARKQVRWNTPFYGKDDGWFLAMYCYKTYVQVTFMAGDSLDPMPLKASEVEGIRYLDIHEADDLDKGQLSSWVKQALTLPGQKL